MSTFLILRKILLTFLSKPTKDMLFSEDFLLDREIEVKLDLDIQPQGFKIEIQMVASSKNYTLIRITSFYKARP